jgi:xanthine dehydrogenase accessory factor
MNSALPGPDPNLFAEARDRIEAEQAVAVVTVVQAPGGVGARMLVLPDGSTEGSLGDEDLERRAVPDAREQLRRGVSKTFSYERDGQESLVFVDAYPAPNRLLVFGGVHIAVPLVKFAKLLGFRVSVIDARGRFASAERFPDADELALEYADEYLARTRVDGSTYVVVLTHDPKLDDPALIHALKTGARYIGAIGSRKTHAKRVERLQAAGLTDQQIARIHAPIGLDIDAQNPEEIALAIAAEMIAAKNGVNAKGSGVRISGPVVAAVTP